MGGYNHWTGLLDYWTTGLDYTGLLGDTGLLDYWTGLLDWTTGRYWTIGLLDWTTGLLEYWSTGLLNWTTGRTQTAKYSLFSAEQKLNVLISSVISLTLLPMGGYNH